MARFASPIVDATRLPNEPVPPVIRITEPARLLRLFIVGREVLAKMRLLAMIS